MKKVRFILSVAAICTICLTGCSTAPDVSTADGVLQRLIEGNETYVQTGRNPSKISAETREANATDGQHPYAIVVSCSDSRVPVEQIFSVGLGELFTVRSAGNVADEVGLGSIEYAVGHFKPPAIVVMGHTQCGAVDATLQGGAEGNIASITNMVEEHIGSETDPTACEILNVQGVMEDIAQSPMIADAIESGVVELVGAIYDLRSGVVSFLDG